MEQNAVPFLKDKRLKIIIILAIIFSALAYVLGFREVTAGILAATPLGILNYWMMWDAVNKERAGKGSTKVVMGRSAIRMVISVAAMIAAIQLVGTLFLLGVMIGMFLHLLTYTFDVVDILTGKKFK